jgi:RNA polymerase sigma-70 factor (ECF subfamily)
MNAVDEKDVHRTIERVARESYGRLVAYLSCHTRDVAGAEDALSEALIAALTAWPRDGVPRNPEAWLLTAARHSLIRLYPSSASGLNRRAHCFAAQGKFHGDSLDD